MGVVYKARQLGLNRVVALKMILAGQLAGDEEVQRFHTEAEAAAMLDHPGIVPIYEIGEHEGQHYFSMGFVEGQSLASRIKDGPLPPREAAGYLTKIAEAIAFAHDRGVIHRDLKPANVLLDRNANPKVTDFGLAKKVEGGNDLTATGQILGTPSFMPPEQASGKLDEIAEPADVYSLGAILYALLVGKPPFQAASHVDTLTQVLHQEPVPPRQLNPKVPRDLETIVLKCLEKERHRRYGSANDVVDELRRFLNDEPIRARPISTPVRALRWCRRNPRAAVGWAITAASVMLTVVGSTSAAIVLEGQRNRESAARQDAETQRGIAERQTERAENALDVTLTSLTLLAQDMQQYLTGLPYGGVEAKRHLLNTCLDQLKRLSEEPGKSAFIRASAQRQRGVIYLEEAERRHSDGLLGKAEEQFQLCLTTVTDENYLKIWPWQKWAHSARANDSLGEVQLLRGDLEGAARYFNTARQQRKKWLEILKAKKADMGGEESARRMELARLAATVSQANLGRIAVRRGKPREAKQYHEAALLTRRESLKSHPKPKPDADHTTHSAWAHGQRELGVSLRAVGRAEIKLGELDSALAKFKETLQLWTEVLDTWDNKPGLQGEYLLRGNIGLARLDIGDTHLLAKRHDPAVEHYKLAEKRLAEMVVDFKDARFRRNYWRTLYGLGTAYLISDSEAATATFAKALDFVPTNPSDQIITLARNGQHQQAAGIATKLAEENPTHPTRLYHAACGYSLCVWAVDHRQDSDEKLVDEYADSAISCLRRAIDNGFEAVHELEQNPELDALRDRDSFQQLVTRMKLRAAQE